MNVGGVDIKSVHNGTHVARAKGDLNLNFSSL